MGLFWFYDDSNGSGGDELFNAILWEDSIVILWEDGTDIQWG